MEDKRTLEEIIKDIHDFVDTITDKGSAEYIETYIKLASEVWGGKDEH